MVAGASATPVHMRIHMDRVFGVVAPSASVRLRGALIWGIWDKSSMHPADTVAPVACSKKLPSCASSVHRRDWPSCAPTCSRCIQIRQIYRCLCSDWPHTLSFDSHLSSNLANAQLKAVQKILISFRFTYYVCWQEQFASRPESKREAVLKPVSVDIDINSA